MPLSDTHHLHYLETASAADKFLDRIAGVHELAVDTEGASFHRFIDRIYLLQLSTRRESAIIDPLPTGKLEKLGALLESPDVEIVFHDADYDLRLLHQDYGWHVRNIFDTRVAAQLLGIPSFGLAALLETNFGVRLDKKHQRADWSMRPLSEDMLAYAAQDTRHLLDLRDRMKAELTRLGRWEWAQEEFTRLEGTRWSSEEDTEAFLRMKGARDLSRRELAVLRELVAWRDEIARGLDRATFRVVGNETLLLLSREAPTEAGALKGVKGMPRAIAERNGESLIAAIGRGLAVPEDQLPRFAKAQRWNRDPDHDARVMKLKEVRDATAQRLGVDPGFLCSRERLDSIVRNAPSTVEALSETAGLRRWQVAEMGEGFLNALRG